MTTKNTEPVASDESGVISADAELFEALGLDPAALEEAVDNLPPVLKPNRAQRRAHFRGGVGKHKGSKPKRRGRPEQSRDEVVFMHGIRAALKAHIAENPPEAVDSPPEEAT